MLVRSAMDMLVGRGGDGMACPLMISSEWQEQRIVARMAQAQANLCTVRDNLAVIQSARWRLLRNAGLYASNRRLLDENWRLILENAADLKW